MIKRFAPLFILLVLGAIVFWSGGYEYLSFESLRANEARLRSWVDARPIVAALGYMVLYFLAALLALPGVLWITIASGLLFGIFWGGTLTAIGATAGAVALFGVARTALGDALLARAPQAFNTFQQGFEKNATSWMLLVRLIPLFPFFMVNIGAAVMKVRLPVFVLTSFFGMLPACYVYASIGNGFASVLQQGGEPNVNILTRPEILFPLLAFAVMVSLPMLWRYVQARRARHS